MKKTSKVFAILLCLALIMTMTTACGSKESGEPAAPAADKDTFVIALDSDIVKLDPAFAYDFTTNPVVNQITQGLLCFDEDNNLEPLLASAWEQVDDLTYVYQIRDDVTFSDGTPMTMEDVIFSMERIRDPETASYLSWMYDSVDTIEQTGDWELTVKLSVPDANWQYVPGTTACHVISKAFAEQAGDALGSPEGGLMGTGPYTYVSWQNGDTVQLTKNENYWGEDAGFFQNLTFKIITEDTTRVAALQTGDADCTLLPPENMLDVLAENENLTMSTAPGFGLVFLAFNTERAPFNDPKVCQALSMGIDLTTIKDSLVKSAGEYASLLPFSSALYLLDEAAWSDFAANNTHVYDPEAAAALLAEAGYADGFDCAITVNDSSLRNSMALAIQDQLSQIGINVTINKVSTDEHTAYQFGDILDANGARDYDMLMAGWEADFPDPSGNIMPLYQGGNSSNSAAYSNADVDALITEQAQSSDNAARSEMMLQIMTQAAADSPYVYLYYPVKNIVINSAYTGVSMNASWIWNIHFQNVRPVE